MYQKVLNQSELWWTERKDRTVLKENHIFEKVWNRENREKLTHFTVTDR